MAGRIEWVGEEQARRIAGSGRTLDRQAEHGLDQAAPLLNDDPAARDPAGREDERVGRQDELAGGSRRPHLGQPTVGTDRPVGRLADLEAPAVPAQRSPQRSEQAQAGNAGGTRATSNGAQASRARASARACGCSCRPRIAGSASRPAPPRPRRRQCSFDRRAIRSRAAVRQAGSSNWRARSSPDRLRRPASPGSSTVSASTLAGRSAPRQVGPAPGRPRSRPASSP